MQPLSYAECSPSVLGKLHHEINATYKFNCQYWTIPSPVGFAVTNLVPLLVLIPLFDRFIYTCLSGWKVFSMFGRIAIGNLFLLFSIIMGLGVEVYRFSLSREMSTVIGSNTLNINVIPFHTESSLVFHVATPMSILLVLPQFFLFAFAEVFANITSEWYL